MRVMNLSPQSNLCFVGSGPYPWSAIRYARKYSCQITAVETRPEAVVLSEGLVKHFGLSEQIKIICADAQMIDYKHFSTVVIAAMVYPKHTLLDVIYPQLASGSRMLVRSAVGQYIFIYDNLDLFHIPNEMRYTILHGDKGCELETIAFSR
jgi:precorrin-6B methylase 2